MTVIAITAIITDIAAFSFLTAIITKPKKEIISNDPLGKLWIILSKANDVQDTQWEDHKKKFASTT